MVSTPSLQRVARVTAGLTSLTGAYGFLYLMGAFGSVSCWTSGGSNIDGPTHGCVTGIDYLFGSTSGNAPVLFFWAVILLGFVTIGGIAAWTEHQVVTWVTTVIGVIISVLGAMSVGWFFIFPTLFLLVAATALSIDTRRTNDGDGTVPTTN